MLKEDIKTINYYIDRFNEYMNNVFSDEEQEFMYEQSFLENKNK